MSDVDELSWDQVRAFRLSRHGLLARRPTSELVEVTRQVCGLQAQVSSAAELQLWARSVDLKPADVRAALWKDRSLVRTWAMRGTLHLLAADELPIYVAALRTHDRWWKGAWLRTIGCSADELKGVLDAIAESLTGDPMTRGHSRQPHRTAPARAHAVRLGGHAEAGRVRRRADQRSASGPERYVRPT